MMTDKEKRDKAVDEFAKQMKKRLDFGKDHQDKDGWDDPAYMTLFEDKLWGHAHKLNEGNGEIKDAIDAANFAMMIWYNKILTMKNKIYISFGTNHNHTVNGDQFNFNTLALIYCDSYSHGRKLAFEAFGPQFSFSYYNDDYDTESWARFNPQIIELNPENKD